MKSKVVAPLSDQDLDQLFLEARTYPKFQDKPVSEDLLRRLHALLRMAPTSQNCQPARFVFVASKEAKDRLTDCVMEGNKAKVASAAVTVIIATDRLFYEMMPKLWHDPNARDAFVKNEAMAQDTAFRNSCLQGAYLIMAARALGLDCGPMSGFDKGAVDAAFFTETPNWSANFLCNLGYGDPQSLFPRSPRPEFDDVCRLL